MEKVRHVHIVMHYVLHFITWLCIVILYWYVELQTYPYPQYIVFSLVHQN